MILFVNVTLTNTVNYENINSLITKSRIFYIKLNKNNLESYLIKLIDNHHGIFRGHFITYMLDTFH